MSGEDARFPCALITGASSGFGWEYARQLAPLSKHLVLVARRDNKLQELKSLIQTESPTTIVTCLQADLSDKEARLNIFQRLNEEKVTPTLLINNAGLGDYGEFISSAWEKIESMMEVNMTALTHLSHLFVPSMKAQGGGHILNVSSLAGLLPIPDFAVYAATKAYVSSFGEALRTELKEHNISVLTVCPGPSKTGFGDTANRSEEQRFESEMYNTLYVPAAQVVSESLDALLHDRARVYPGWKVALLAAGISFLPLVAIRAFNSKRFRKSATLDHANK